VKALFALLLAGLLLTSGCTTRVGDLTVASPKNVPRQFRVVKERVVGRDCGYRFLFFNFGVLNPSTDGAIDSALASVPGADALMNANLFTDFVEVILFAQTCVRVEGKAVSTR
jgi:hypothetical protein